MAVHSSSDPEEPAADERVVEEPDETLVAAHETCPGRTVFTEDDNTDAWIATDLTVELER
ncbi:hypothetical protein G9464_15825 [Halostella sp. JP-L12]|uniref:hypothetical protein n=1 Tax=Halostella TaxID=1843185 RepID=UPI000EF82E35|nr:MULTISPECIES: hypothetical protein [Halostella]NHN49050.1 hypothetical protein [Halostella sp. JP-L12]